MNIYEQFDSKEKKSDNPKVLVAVPKICGWCSLATCRNGQVEN
jgi:hypothetical protein